LTPEQGFADKAARLCAFAGPNADWSWLVFAPQPTSWTGMVSIVLMIAVAAAAGQAVPSRAVVQRAVERLDMSSFPNSLGPAAKGTKKTLRQFGAQRFKWEDGRLEVTEASGDWARTFQPLKSPPGRIRLCFHDQALKGTYLTSQAIELAPGRGGLYRAKAVKDRGCEDYAR
jgi:hypothetical protein